MNLYDYVGNNPDDSIDPNGLATIVVTLTGNQPGNVNIGNGYTLVVDPNTVLEITNVNGGLLITSNKELDVNGTALGFLPVHISLSKAFLDCHANASTNAQSNLASNSYINSQINNELTTKNPDAANLQKAVSAVYQALNAVDQINGPSTHIHVGSP